MSKKYRKCKQYPQGKKPPGKKAASRKVPGKKPLPLDRALKKVIVRSYAWGVITAYFGWGTRGPWNRNEQICALGGRINNQAILVEAALPLLGAGASPGHIEVKAETWLRAIWALQDMGMELVGSVHSHPNELAVFMSGADLRTHRKMFPRGASLVLNPHYKEIAAFDQTQKHVPIQIATKNTQEEPHHERMEKSTQRPAVLWDCDRGGSSWAGTGLPKPRKAVDPHPCRNTGRNAHRNAGQDVRQNAAPVVIAHSHSHP